MDATRYPQRTICESLDASVHNRTWGSYFQAAPTTLFFDYVLHPKTVEKLHSFLKVKDHVNNGQLRSYSWLEPRCLGLKDVRMLTRLALPPSRSIFLVHL